jgi:transcriptional regulator of acetoin/glycerol metabolism
MTEVERRVVLETLTSHGWRMTAAAAALGLERSHLYKKLKALGISKPE